MARWSLDELVRFVRSNSPFYRALYSSLPEGLGTVESLPILDQGEYWKANGLENNAVLTGPMHDGIVFKSGGTTGSPKFSVFSKAEWAAFNAIFGRGIAAANIKAGDRVANLFYAGQLYGSFLFITKSLEESPLDVLQLPVGGGTSVEETAQIVADFGVNVIAGVPTTILNLAEYVSARGLAKRFNVERVLFGGEAMYPDQRERLAEVFPGVRALSIGYASTDAGPLGYVDASCGPNEHRTFGGDTILEVVDEETREPIEETGREGLLIATDLGRSLMPIIRYPVGDRGLWLEPKGSPDRKFLLMGRSEEAAKIGLVKLYVEDVRKVLLQFKKELGAANFQMLVEHRDRLDGLVLRIAPAAGARPDGATAERIIAAIHAVRPLYEQFVGERLVRAMKVEWAAADGLETNPRTGKMRKVIDRRAGGS
ncbi:MAG TPA: AMP-binding protein [Elusimicrobiota bacterium]|jgi:phenylacetate-CoA ligase|nr:AMP-binding protein [Elusimicrobiota bacterium]